MPRQDDSFDEAKDKLHEQFESATQSQFDRPRPDRVELDEGAVNGPGGDSRPDLIDPATAQFHNATPELGTTRENLPSVNRPEGAENRNSEQSGVSARPTGPEFSQEKAVVEVHEDSRQPVAEIMDEEREGGGEGGGMGRKNVPKDDPSQGTWHDDPDAVTDNVPS
jgi:hypothetical protein